mgnify:FL=1
MNNNGATVIDKIYHLNNESTYHDNELEKLLNIANKLQVGDICSRKTLLFSYISELYCCSRNRNDLEFLAHLYSKTHI